LTYQEVFDWIDEQFDIDTEDLGEEYERISNEWNGRSDLSNVISLDDFLSYYERN